jgi:flagellar biogenesis protein FliO
MNLEAKRERSVKSRGMEDNSDSRSSEEGEPQSFGAAILSRIRAAFSEVRIQRRTRRLKLCETLSLGEKRILALVECENRRFLIAATAQNISLLETLSVPEEGGEKPQP